MVEAMTRPRWYVTHSWIVDHWEWYCVADTDLPTFLGNCCQVNHKTREAARRHCAKLNGRKKP